MAINRITRDALAEMMIKFNRQLYVLVPLLFLLGCSKGGVDASLSSKNEHAYRETLNRAWVKMTPEQQEAFNWAVSNFTLEQLFNKYEELTPRSVITAEANEYIALQQKKIFAATKEMTKNAAELLEQEKILKEVTEELAEITVSGTSLKKDIWGKEEVAYTVQNDSAYNLTSMLWDAWLFIDSEAQSTRHCTVYSGFKHDGGLPSGKARQRTVAMDNFGCAAWDTLEVKNAKTLSFRFDLKPESVKDFAEKTILPDYRVTRQSYQERIDDANKEIEKANMAKAALTE